MDTQQEMQRLIDELNRNKTIEDREEDERLENARHLTDSMNGERIAKERRIEVLKEICKTSEEPRRTGTIPYTAQQCRSRHLSCQHPAVLGTGIRWLGT